MPELPDLTVFAENLSKGVIGKEIVAVEFSPTKKSSVTAEELAASLKGTRIEAVRRVGKQLAFRLANGSEMYVHLMLNGGFVLATADQAKRLDYLVLAVSFADGSAMAVTDPKGWAVVSLNPALKTDIPDGLAVTVDYLKAAFAKRPKALAKAFLIDQERIGGIGNAYSDEILWRAKISPKSAVGKLPPEAIEALAEAIPAVLNEAIEEIRKRRPGAVSGEVRDFLKVHGPGRKVSPTGGRIIKEQLQSKITYYTDEQKLYS